MAKSGIIEAFNAQSHNDINDLNLTAKPYLQAQGQDVLKSLGLDPTIFSSGQGQANEAELNSVMKAIMANQGITDLAARTGGGALEIISFEETVKRLSFQMTDLKIFNKLRKEKVFTTTPVYTKQHGYGVGGGVMSNEMSLPVGADPNYKGYVAIMKYMRDVWRTSDVAIQTRMIEDPVGESQRAAMMRMLRALNIGLYFQSNAVIDEEFTGIVPQVFADNPTNGIIDARGATLTESNFFDAAYRLSMNFSSDNLETFMSPAVLSSLGLIFSSDARARMFQNQGSLNLRLGNQVVGVDAPTGQKVDFVSDKWLSIEAQEVPFIIDPTTFAKTEGATSPNAPSTPTFTLTAQVATAGSLFAATGSGGAIAGAYQYRVVARNAAGQSIAAAAQTATVAVGGSIAIAITMGGGAYPVQAYDIYRETTPGSGVIRFMKTVKFTASPQTVVDLNDYLPGTSYVIMMDTQGAAEFDVMKISELSPMYSQEYAKVGPYKWGAMNHYLALKYYNTFKIMVFRNVGVSSGALVRSAYFNA